MGEIELSAIAFLLALGVSLAVGINADRIGRLFGLLDFPDPRGGRKRHEHVTPLVGGMAVVLSVVPAALLSQAVLGVDSPAIDTHMSWFALAVSCMYLVGMTDDRFALSPKIRLLLAVGVLAVVVLYATDFTLSFLRFSGQRETFFLGGVGDAFTLLCLVGLLNAVNMADGKNGLVISMGLIWSGVLTVYAPVQLWPVLIAVITSLAILLWFNARGRLFLGDGGSYGLSALFGLLAIYVYNHSFDSMRADHVAVLFAVPVFDTIRLMTVRAVRGRSPFAADRDHLHHHLAFRWGWPRGLYIYVSLVALPNLLTLVLPDAALLWLAGALLAYAAVLTHSTRHGRFAPDGAR